MNIPLTEKKSGEMSMIRVRRTASAWSSACLPESSPSPGAIRGTSSGASSSPSSASTAVATKTRLSTELASRQASSLLCRVK